MFLTKNEQAIMEIFWSKNRALSRADILSVSEKKWSPPSLSAFLNNLLEKEAIKVSGYFKDGKTVGRTFEANISKEDYFISQIGTEKPNLTKILTAFISESEYEQELIGELEDFVEKKKKQWESIS